MSSALLEVTDLVVEFGGVRALDGASVTVAEGETVGIIGPNGAGKSTLINCITRYYRPRSGEIRFRGRSVASVRPSEVSGLGIARTFQNLELFERQSVADNVFFGAVHRLRGIPPWRPAARLKLGRQTGDLVGELLRDLGLEDVRERRVCDLSYPQRKRVEFARAMATHPRLLLLDEPTAGLGDEESARFAAVIRRMHSRYGVSLAIIAHDMPFIFSLCEQIYVFDAGRALASGSASEIERDPNVRRVYLGEGT